MFYNLTMKIVDYNIFNGQKNMDIDSEILEESIRLNRKEAVLRFYGWSPACVSLGRNQKDDFIDYNLLKKYGVDCVRRLTGGRALFHDKELTYSYVIPVLELENGENITESYKQISGILIDIFEKLGIKLTIGGLERHITRDNYCMSVSTGADLCFDGRKFIGSAQCRKNGYILQHGSILLDYDKNLIDKIFHEDTDFSTIVTLKEINSDITLDDIISIVKTL